MQIKHAEICILRKKKYIYTFQCEDTLGKDLQGSLLKYNFFIVQ